MSTSNSVDDSGRKRWVILVGLGILALLVSLLLAEYNRSGTNSEPPRQTGTPSAATTAATTAVAPVPAGTYVESPADGSTTVPTSGSATVPTIASTAPPPSTTG